MRCFAASVVLCLVLCHQAAAQSCPSTPCKADFNAQGGYIDCCKWDYNKGTCRWAGTPVSFRLVRTCAQDGKTYPVLTQSNTQGPPGPTECRCPNAQGPQLQVLQACISMKPRADMDISGQDIACKSNQFCQVCGSVEEVKNACMQDNRCVAFSYEQSTSCGYLKTAPFYKERKGWVAYTRD